MPTDPFQQAVDANQNSAVTVILEQFKSLTAEVQRNRADNRDMMEGLRAEVRDGNTRIQKQLEDHENRLRLVEKEIPNLSARLTMSQILSNTFTVIAGTIAAIVGANR